MSPQAWIILTAALTAASCAILGSWLVLRRMAMMGDSLSHAVLPGIVLAFLFTHSRNVPTMLIGATVCGLLAVLCMEWLGRTRLVHSDSAIGVTFTFLFALGVILISAYAGSVDLDQDCVLFGEIAYVPWDTWTISGWNMGPRAVWLQGTALLIDLLFVTLCLKELQITTFDAQHAHSVGISPRAMHYILMMCVAITTVAAFDSVGAILVVALLVVPPATAVLLSRRLVPVLILAVVCGIASAVGGYAFASALDVSIAGAIACAAGALFFLAVLIRLIRVPARWKTPRPPAQNYSSAATIPAPESAHRPS